LCTDNYEYDIADASPQKEQQQHHQQQQYKEE
jgi:hypothetical protein